MPESIVQEPARQKAEAIALPAKKLPASNAEDWPCRFTSGQPFLELDGGIPPSEAKARTLSPGPPSVAAISNYLSARGKAYPVPTTYLDR